MLLGAIELFTSYETLYNGVEGGGGDEPISKKTILTQFAGLLGSFKSKLLGQKQSFAPRNADQRDVLKNIVFYNF